MLINDIIRVSKKYVELNQILISFTGSTHIQDSTPYIVTLNPGDILFVPHKWWHYVEHLSTSLSLNTWIPLHNVKYLIQYYKFNS